MLSNELERTLTDYTEGLKSQGLYKKERQIITPQGAKVKVIREDGSEKQLLNFCANNYLGLADNPQIIEAAKNAMDRWGYGLSSVRFICGTQALHKKLEKKISEFLRTEDTILFSSCFDANGAAFEPLLGAEDVIISDALNHASIIDGVRLCKAQRMRYSHSSMDELEACLKDAQKYRRRIIVTDGVFSMDGDIAKLPSICDLAERYDSLVMVDDSHATGYIGKTGRGTGEYWGVADRIDLVSTTFGKALGGASGGCISGRKALIDIFRQASRPYLFSNTLAPAIAGGTLKCIELLEGGNPYRQATIRNAGLFRRAMEDAGFDLVKGDTAIVPVMLYDEVLAVKMASMLEDEGVFVTGFCYPVVPKGKARIRVQLSAAHTEEDIKTAVNAFIRVAERLGMPNVK
jgi:glycine C-acetyltransferase